MFSGVNAAKPVTIQVPGTALAGYGPSPTNTTTGNWGNGFRGGGWVRIGISLTIEKLP
jgi:hypothetical protein